MHDEVSSGLAALKYYVADLKEQAKSEETRNTLADVQAEVQSVYEQSRTFMHGLNAGNSQTEYDAFNLLQNLSIRFSSGSGLEIRTRVSSLLEHQISPRQNSELYMIIKEAVANCLKHSGASNMDIRIDEKGEFIILDIKDNGHGLVSTSGKGLGMTTIRERMEGLGGVLEIESLNSGFHMYGTFPKAA